MWITTSWDDGHRLDLRLADLLDRYHLKGTFYLFREGMENRLSDAEIRGLSTRHEIGAHTLTHPDLTQIDLPSARAEIAGSRAWLRDLTGDPITAFAYPYGTYNQLIIESVAELGFTCARTVNDYTIHPPKSPYIMPTTVQVTAFPFHNTDSFSGRIRPLATALPHIFRLRLSPLSLRTWRDMAITLLKRAIKTDGIWHLWGHSWQIEEMGMWRELEEVLKFAGQYAQYAVTNSELAQAVFANE